jgi:hypothetical protein
MLRNDPCDESLEDAWHHALDVLPQELKKYAAASPEIWSMQYPIAEQLLKVKSLSFKEKGDSFSGKLLGIRGQYLMLENGVFNVRAHHGHRVDLEIR